MKKFIRNLLSGYLLVLLLLLLEIGVLVVVQFFSEPILEAILDKIGVGTADAFWKTLLTIGIYLLVRAVVFVIALIIFFKISSFIVDTLIC